jgi:hypothetical protein
MTLRTYHIYALLVAAWVIVACLSLAVGTCGVSLGDYWNDGASLGENLKGFAQLPHRPTRWALPAARHSGPPSRSR